MTQGGTKNAQGFYEGGSPTGKYTSCWSGNFKYPGYPSSGAPALNADNHKPQATFTAGDLVDLSWIVNANHGGMTEYAIVCDGDETYANFKKNRLERVSTNNGVLSTGNGEKDGKPHWAFFPTQVSNQRFEDKVKLPEHVHGDRCVAAWFWWGYASQGTFIACTDIKILPKSGGSQKPVDPSDEEPAQPVQPAEPVQPWQPADDKPQPEPVTPKPQPQHDDEKKHDDEKHPASRDEDTNNNNNNNNDEHKNNTDSDNGNTGGKNADDAKTDPKDKDNNTRGTEFIPADHHHPGVATWILIVLAVLLAAILLGLIIYLSCCVSKKPNCKKSSPKKSAKSVKFAKSAKNGLPDASSSEAEIELYLTQSRTYNGQIV